MLHINSHYIYTKERNITYFQKNNISIDNLLNLLKDYNIKLYDTIIDDIIKRILN